MPSLHSFRLPLSAFSLLLSLSCASCATAKDEKAPAAPNPAELAVKTEQRTNEILKELNLADSAKASAVHAIISAQYKFLQDWQATNDEQIKALKKASNDKDAAVSTKAKTDLTALMETRKAQRVKYLADLAQHLTPEQIELVKDKMTYFKVKVTFNAYCAQNPTLTEEAKTQILTWLKEAREEAIDGGSSEEKSEIFGKYKGRINNYLSKNGYTKKK